MEEACTGTNAVVGVVDGIAHDVPKDACGVVEVERSVVPDQWCHLSDDGVEVRWSVEIGVPGGLDGSGERAAARLQRSEPPAGELESEISSDWPVLVQVQCAARQSETFVLYCGKGLSRLPCGVFRRPGTPRGVLLSTRNTSSRVRSIRVDGRRTSGNRKVCVGLGRTGTRSRVPAFPRSVRSHGVPNHEYGRNLGKERYFFFNRRRSAWYRSCAQDSKIATTRDDARRENEARWVGAISCVDYSIPRLNRRDSTRSRPRVATSRAKKNNGCLRRLRFLLVSAVQPALACTPGTVRACAPPPGPALSGGTP